jgi:hypothetical protein
VYKRRAVNLDINFVKEQFEIAKKASHLSETIVIDVKTAEWLVEQAELVKHLLEENLKQSLKYQLLLDNWLESKR